VRAVVRNVSSDPPLSRAPCVPKLCDATASGAEDGQVWLARGQEELCLCGHHFAEHELILAVSGWQVTHDIRS
jgi:hypothetical protein